LGGSQFPDHILEMLIAYLVRLTGGPSSEDCSSEDGSSAMMAVLYAEQSVSIWAVCVWERFARSGSEEKRTSMKTCEHSDVVVRPKLRMKSEE
jgi:hypothetical protein